MRARRAAGDGSPTLHMAEGTTFTVTQNVHAKGDFIVDGKISTETCVGMPPCPSGAHPFVEHAHAICPLTADDRAHHPAAKPLAPRAVVI